MIYLLQLLNAGDFEKTLEVDADSISELREESSKMVANNPQVKGMEYRIFKMPIKDNGMWDTRNAVMLKQDRIAA